MTLRHTLDSESAINFTGGDLRISFAAGSRETDEYDEETERRAVELYDAVEFADAEPEHEALGETGPDVDATDEERTVEDEAADLVEEIEAADDVDVEVSVDEDADDE